MSKLSDFQKGLIDSSIAQARSIIEDDYTISRLHRSLADLDEEIGILPQYKDYAIQRVHHLAKYYHAKSKRYYRKYGKLDSKYMEVTLNLSNFK